MKPRADRDHARQLEIQAAKDEFHAAIPMPQIENPTPRQLDRTPCRNGDPNRFFPEGDVVAQWHAKTECKSLCPIRAHCLEVALKLEEDDTSSGIWGGTTPAERRRMRIKAEAAA